MSNEGDPAVSEVAEISDSSKNMDEEDVVNDTPADTQETNAAASSNDENSSDPQEVSDNGNIEDLKAPLEAVDEGNAMEMENTEPIVTPDPTAIEMRRFEVAGLRQPGGWKKCEEFFSLLNHCESFSMNFEPASRSGGQKFGTATLIFGDAYLARDAYKTAETIRVYGRPFELKAESVFYAPLPPPYSFFDVPSDQFERDRTVYALYLTNGADRNLLESIFGADTIQDCHLLPLLDNGNHAKLVLLSVENAQSARVDVDGFELDDGEQQTTMRILTCEEYEQYIATASQPVSFSATREELVQCSQSQQSQSQDESVDGVNGVGLPEPTEENIVQAIHQHVHRERINWVDLSEKEDIYALIDVISAYWNGLPDSLLKPCMLTVFNQHLGQTQAGWMRQHLESLIKLWKGEVLNDELFERPSRVAMAAPKLEPVPLKESRKRKRIAGGAERASSLRQNFGLGALLERVKAEKIRIDDGVVDVDEDETGNFSIGGQALSFESWAKMNQKDLVPVKPTSQQLSDPKFKKEIEQRRAEKKQRKTEERRQQKALKAAKDAKLAMKEQAADENEEPKVEVVKELEEGEVDSGDERSQKSTQKVQPAKKKKASSTSSSSSSSSSDSDSDDGLKGSRQRRKERRKKERKNVGNQPRSLPPLFQDLFDHRHQVVAALSAEHRSAFAAILHQMQSKDAGSFTNYQQEQLLKFSKAFG